MRTEKEKMLAGELYNAADSALQAELAATQPWHARYNAALDASPAFSSMASRSGYKVESGPVTTLPK
jgi:hypothetical protein